MSYIMPALDKIGAHFGASVIDAIGALDRAALRKIVFADKSALSWLENLTHPLIRQHLLQALADLSAPYAILVSPLLLETDQHEMADRVLVVDVPEELQLQRAMARDQNQADQIKRIMASQADRSTRLAKADDILLNDADIAALESRVAALHKTYLEIARQQ